jgi:hypothetical protein
MKLGDLHIPKGLNLCFPRLAIHHNYELWGAYAHEFKLKIFVDGIAKASKNPFGFYTFFIWATILCGTRICFGGSKINVSFGTSTILFPSLTKLLPCTT